MRKAQPGTNLTVVETAVLIVCLMLGMGALCVSWLVAIAFYRFLAWIFL